MIYALAAAAADPSQGHPPCEHSIIFLQALGKWVWEDLHALTYLVVSHYHYNAETPEGE
jgi:hypothetical protein